MSKLLLVEDDRKILDFNREVLEENGYTVYPAINLAEAQKRLEKLDADLIVLDVMLPDGSGIDWLAELRATSRVPVLLLTAKNGLPDKLKGFESGADDYLTKPYDYEELLARAGALLRRADYTPEQVTYGRLMLDINSGRAYYGGWDLALRQKEFALLLLFAQMRGKALSGEYIYQRIWKQPIGSDKNTLQTTISRLRAKLENTGLDIYYERGSGYTLE
ncbi:MAG: response regulator transcription factor [Oscillospiraceae bacterium]|jgi:DNA-binding response OmpR family regulator|nr:response regulator transcription factor [Oscillospiraceae bacterium]